MVRARAEGKHVGRPLRPKPVTERRLWHRILAGLDGGHLTKAEEAKRLRVRRAVLDEALRVHQAGGLPVSLATALRHLVGVMSEVSRPRNCTSGITWIQADTKGAFGASP
jgi:hypothetical protein